MDAPSPGWTIGDRYRVIGPLGSGGMAEVLRAHDELLGRDVAVKVFHNRLPARDAATADERRRAELHALAQVNHPNLITLYDGSLSATPAYLVMELVDGSTLAGRIAEGPLAEPEVRRIGRQVADALDYIHERGMVHRDVKPANILVGHDGRTRLSDFGIVQLVDAQELTSADLTLGTACYLAPEQTRGSRVGPPADIYALGLTLIEAISGVRAFDGPPLQAAMARLERDPVIPDQAAGEWPRLLAAMTARDPEQRPTAGEVARALQTDAAVPAPVGLPDSHTAEIPVLPAGAAAMYDASVGAYDDAPPRRHVGRWVAAGALGLAGAAVAVAVLAAPSAPARNPGSPAGGPGNAGPVRVSGSSGSGHARSASAVADTRHSSGPASSSHTSAAAHHKHHAAKKAKPAAAVTSTAPAGPPAPLSSASSAPASSSSPAPSPSPSVSSSPTGAADTSSTSPPPGG